MLLKFILKEIYKSYYRFCKKINYVPLRLSNELDALKIKNANEFLFFQNYKKENESLLDAKKRFFLSLRCDDQKIAETQQKDLSLLKSFIQICKKNNLTYFVCGGTALGAVRHNGFIPWDDDVDVAMSSDDFSKLLSAMKDNNDFKIIDYALAFSNMRIYKFKFANDDDIQSSYYVDIFLYDLFNVSYDKCLKLRRKFIKKGRLRTILNPCVRYAFRKNGVNNYMPIECSSRYISYFNLLTKNNNAFKNKLRKKSDNKYEQELVFNTFRFNVGREAALHEWPLVYPAKNIFPLKSIKFCDIEVFIPSNFDICLKAIYGNYYSLPSDFNNHSM